MSTALSATIITTRDKSSSNHGTHPTPEPPADSL